MIFIKGDSMLDQEDLKDVVFECEGKSYEFIDAVKIDALVSKDDGDEVYNQCSESLKIWLTEQNVRFGDGLLLIREVKTESI